MPKKQTRFVRANFIRQECDSRGWNNKELAAKAVIDATTVGKALDKREAISIEIIAKMAAALNLTAGDIIQSVDDENEILELEFKVRVRKTSDDPRLKMAGFLESLEDRVSTEYEIVGISAKYGSLIISSLIDSLDLGRVLEAYQSGDLDDLAIEAISLSRRKLASTPSLQRFAPPDVVTVAAAALIPFFPVVSSLIYAAIAVAKATDDKVVIRKDSQLNTRQASGD